MMPVRRALSLGHHDEDEQHGNDAPSSPLLPPETDVYAVPDYRGRAVSDYSSAKPSPYASAITIVLFWYQGPCDAVFASRRRLVASPPKPNPRRSSVLAQFFHAVKPSWGAASTASGSSVGHHAVKKSALDPHEIDAPQLAADTHEMGIQLAAEDDDGDGTADESEIELAAPREAATSASRAITTAHTRLYDVK
jgi:hypothetical protein